MKMVVPGSAPIIQPDHSLGNELGRVSTENSVMGPDVEPVADQVGPELEEVRKLQELVRRLELQNQQLRTRSLRSLPEANVLSQAGAGVDNCNSRLNGMEINNGINTLMDKQELQIVADLHSALSKMRSEAEVCGEFLKNDVDAVVQHNSASGSEREPSKTDFASNVEMQSSDADTNDFSNWDCDSTVLVEGFATEGVEPVSRMSEGSANVDNLLKKTTLDEVEVLELESGSVEDDSWLYVSPRKPSTSEKESPLKWCRQVLDNPSPETEAACRTLIGRLDQASRWKSLYCSPLASPSVHNLNTDTGSCSSALNSPGHYKSTNKSLLTCGSSGYLGMHSALSSQSSVDSELSTSDDSISMGYKLQDLTDVQVMARLQEESLRQDCASSSASVSRRSSSASLHSLRRGTYSDQDFDTYSLEDEDDDCSFSYHSNHRYSPSPLSSPRCQSPSTNTDYGRATGSQIRPPRRTLQSPMQDRLKYSGNEEELRYSMPNLARTGLRSLESVRNSRSLESDLQVPSRLSRMQQPSASLAPSKLRFSSSTGQSHLTVRQPMKAASCANSLLTPRQPVRAPGYASPAGRVRKLPSSTLNPSGSSMARNNSMAGGAKHSLPKGRISIGGPSSLKSKLTQPAKRFPKASVVSVDDSWKDGCY
ncbi:SLAIN motif-containing protein-like isoform X2 [Sceloporus undulatus]|nr:SLAIN motif-containing protein-like isoform X2 [Sceloporus undulatus]XP_042333810.1 SLAIN motif-containing protein-like isoform X2 [Sceloporus undulatus]XP_042333811.1 SLAIN motif-containing protein-like isoform X2 [Sceloporus undulatus]